MVARASCPAPSTRRVSASTAVACALSPRRRPSSTSYARRADAPPTHACAFVESRGANAASRRSRDVAAHPVARSDSTETRPRRTPARRAWASDRSRPSAHPTRAGCGDGSHRARAWSLRRRVLEQPPRAPEAAEPRPVLRRSSQRATWSPIQRKGGPAGRQSLRPTSTAIAVASSSSTAARSSPGRARPSRSARRLGVVTQQRYCTRACPQPERVRLLVRLVVPVRRHLQHRLRAGRRDEGEASERERLAQFDARTPRRLPSRSRPAGRDRAVPSRCVYFATSIARDSRITITLTWPGILELVLDLARDLVREQRGAVVVDLGRLDDHADLATRLQRVRLRHAGLRRGDLLERREPLDVVLEALAAGARTRGRDRVRGDQQHRLDRLRLDLVVVRLDRVDDPVRLAVAPRQLRRDERVRPLDLVRHRLADVVEERGALRGLHAGAELGRHDPREVDDLERVLEDVLPVARPVPQAAEDLDELLVELAAVRLEHGLRRRPGGPARRARPSTGSTSPRSAPGGSARPRSASRA